MEFFKNLLFLILYGLYCLWHRIYFGYPRWDEEPESDSDAWHGSAWDRLPQECPINEFGFVDPTIWRN